MDLKREKITQLVLEIVKLLSAEEKKQILNKIIDEKELPISVFRTKNLSGLEAVIIYLKNNKNQSVKAIAKTLNRKKSTIYTTYYNAKRKLKGKLDISDLSITVPLDIFSNRKFSILESLVFYLKKNKKIPLIKISSLLNKSYSTVKTAHQRYKQKNK